MKSSWWNGEKENEKVWLVSQAAVRYYLLQIKKKNNAKTTVWTSSCAARTGPADIVLVLYNIPTRKTKREKHWNHSAILLSPSCMDLRPRKKKIIIIIIICRPSSTHVYTKFSLKLSASLLFPVSLHPLFYLLPSSFTILIIFYFKKKYERKIVASRPQRLFPSNCTFIKLHNLMAMKYLNC